MILIVIFILLIVSIFELVYLFKRHEKKEAIIYIALLVLTLPIAIYVSFAPKFVSFIELVFGLSALNRQRGVS